MLIFRGKQKNHKNKTLEIKFYILDDKSAPDNLRTSKSFYSEEEYCDFFKTEIISNTSIFDPRNFLWITDSAILPMTLQDEV